MSRKLASFYTPEPVAQVLTDWAITNVNAKVLDPSFGGCAFLCAALETLQKLGNSVPGKHIYGVDIDPKAQSYLEPLYSAGASTDQFIEADFFDVVPQQLTGKDLFDAVVGNPPYIRYHDIPGDMQNKAVNRLNAFGISISGRASYWAFFLLYSIQFLKVGGRLAMVLPGALLHTDYSTQIRELLVQHFQQVTICLLEERIFRDTEEESVLVCAEGAHKPHIALRIGSISTIAHLGEAFRDLEQTAQIFKNNINNGQLLNALISPDTIQIYNQLIENTGVIRADDWVTTRIGVVTGNNKYFILTPSERQNWKLPDEIMVPIVRRATQLTGLWVTNQRLEENPKHDVSKHLLIGIPHGYTMAKSIKSYISHGETLGVNKATKCADRKPWYVVPHTSSPPAFMPIMSASWPRLVVNNSGYTCTNNILKVFWKTERSPEDWTRLALGTLSTLSQLSAELVGRSYGGGVLKLEPKEFAALIVPLVPEGIASTLAQKVDNLLRQKNYIEATRLVDEALLNTDIDINEDKLVKLKAARNHLFLRRRQHRRDAQKILSAGLIEDMD